MDLIASLPGLIFIVIFIILIDLVIDLTVFTGLASVTTMIMWMVTREQFDQSIETLLLKFIIGKTTTIVVPTSTAGVITIGSACTSLLAGWLLSSWGLGLLWRSGSSLAGMMLRR